MNSTFENWIENNLDSQHGKTILVTGGNAGIGYQTALALAKAGASVVIAGRSSEKIEKAKQDIEAEGIEGDVTTGIIDLASLKSTELQRHVDPALLARFEFMEDWQGSLPSIVAATSGEVKGGQYYGPDGPGEMSGYPALGVIDDAALDEKTSKRLWEEAEKITGISFPE